ncbi:MAG: nitrous oxide-stimulated promoter family protein [Dehalococcoidales bacterium]|nr:nitrous oxide-stimulated promoter family protein [Dehalococcoidales bacterium]
MSKNSQNSRIAREAKTIEVMLDLYCRHHHAGVGLCGECRELLDYARERLKRCPFQAGKTTCARCRVHCYKPAMREKIRVVMRYSGPRMMSRHPVLAIAHFIDSLRKEPVRKI